MSEEKITTLSSSFKTVNTALLAELESNKKSIKLYQDLTKQQMDREHIKDQTITRLQGVNENLSENLFNMQEEKEAIEKENAAYKIELIDTRMAFHDTQCALKRSRCDLEELDTQYSIVRHKLSLIETVANRHFVINILLIITITAMVITVL